MKILVTGSEGFIGTHLVRELIEHGHEVTGVDFEDGDLREEGVADALIERYQPEWVVHLAAQVGIWFNEQDQIHAINSNVIMTLRVARACARYGVRLCHTSTSEVYGDVGERLVDEDEPLTGRPTGIYALTKRWSEDIVREIAPQGLIIIRPSMPYGTGAPPGKGRRALDNMLWQAYHHKPIIVHRGAVRSWCWIGDAVRGWRMILERGEEGVYNIGRDDAEVSMLDVARRACQLANAPESLIQEVPPPARKTMIKRLSTRKLFALGWRPEVELDEGMKHVYEWVKIFPWTE